jgi:hypothetical protein
MSNNYIDNKQFLEAIIDRKATLKQCRKLKLQKPQLSNYIGSCLLLIAQNLSHLPRFKDYPHKEEMIGDAVENCVRYFDNYNTKYKNPHAYFTQISYYAFVRRIKKEKDILYAKYKIHEQVGVLGMDGAKEESINGQFQVYENIADFIATYEEKREERKQKLAEKRVLAKKGKKAKKVKKAKRKVAKKTKRAKK